LRAVGRQSSKEPSPASFTSVAKAPLKEEGLNEKAFLFGFVAGLALLALAGAGAFHLARRGQASAVEAGHGQKTAEELEREFRTELAVATPVEPGVLTPRQRMHSRLFGSYGPMRDRMGDYKRISSLAGQPKGQIFRTLVTPGLAEAPAPETRESFFGKLARESEAVIIGTVQSNASQITEDDAFVFTDYDIRVTEVIKDNPVSPIGAGTSIVVTGPGGKVSFGGIIAEAIDQNVLTLPSGGHRLLLFLRFIEDTGAYRATRNDGSFELDGASVRPLTMLHLPQGVLTDSSSLLGSVRGVANR
jgi:hypothetical protein